MHTRHWFFVFWNKAFWVQQQPRHGGHALIPQTSVTQWLWACGAVRCGLQRGLWANGRLRRSALIVSVPCSFPTLVGNGLFRRFELFGALADKDKRLVMFGHACFTVGYSSSYFVAVTPSSAVVPVGVPVFRVSLFRT
jgi:hypothetical protein